MSLTDPSNGQLSVSSGPERLPQPLQRLHAPGKILMSHPRLCLTPLFPPAERKGYVLRGLKMIQVSKVGLLLLVN